MNDTRRLDALWAQHRTLDTITAEMHSTGMWVNKQWRDFLTHCAQESIEQKRQRVVELVNVDGFEATPHQLRGIIYRRHAKPSLHRFDLPDPYDKKMFTDETCRTISVSEDKLLLLMVSGGCPDELLPIIEAWWDYQGELKRRSMLTSEKFDQAIGPDNRLRPGWNSCGTDTGRFACFTGETEVTSGSGPKRIDEVRIGDVVWTHQRRWRSVTNVFRQGIHQVRTYRFSTGAILTCTVDHRFLCSDGSWRTIQEIEHERFEIVGAGAGESTSGAGSVQKHGAHADDGTDSRGAFDGSPQCWSSDSEVLTSGGTEGPGSGQILTLENWSEQPTLWQARAGDAELGGGLRRRVRIPDAYVARQAHVRAPDCDNGTPGTEVIAGWDGRSPHRQQSEEQRTEQSGAGDQWRAQDDSLSAGKGQSGCFVEESHAAGSAEVFDLEVAEDHSFEVAGVWAHNCSQPNVMNIEQMLRAVFGPPPGYVWVHADKSQLELRVMAVVAADNVLTDALNTGDVYSYDAKNMFNLPADANVKKDHAGLRKSAKIIRLGRQYGAGEKTILGQALRQDRRFTFARTKLLVKTWDKVNYRIPEYWREEMSRVQECSYSESRLMMRRRYYPRPPDLNETVNYPVQATAADIMNTEIITVWKRLAVEVPAARIVTQLHDAIDVECREVDQPAVERIIDQEMNRDWSFCGRTANFPIERKTATHTDTWSAV